MCKNESEIDRFLKTFYFTFYTLQQRVEFTSDNFSKNPLKTTNTFHSQFQLFRDQYRDNNNFIRINKVSATDNRFAIFDTALNYNFIDFVQNPTWIGASSAWEINVSRDYGKTFNTETQLQLWGSYFFLSEEIVSHTRSVQSVIQILSDLGGIIEIFFLGFAVLNIWFNDV